MNFIRSILSVFLVCVVVIVLSGLKWASTQPSPKAEGAMIALALCGVMCLGVLGVLWSTKRPQVD